MFKIWIMALIGISVLGFLYKTIIPDGKTSKVAAFVFSIVMLLCMIKPLLSLCEFENFPSFAYFSDERLSEKNDEYQRNFIEKYYTVTLTYLLKKHDIDLKKAMFELTKTDEKFIIKKIIIYRSDLVYSGDDDNINITSQAIDIISDFTGLEKKYVCICE